jgi:hypothetical protein
MLQGGRDGCKKTSISDSLMMMMLMMLYQMVQINNNKPVHFAFAVKSWNIWR